MMIVKMILLQLYANIEKFGGANLKQKINYVNNIITYILQNIFNVNEIVLMKIVEDKNIEKY